MLTFDSDRETARGETVSDISKALDDLKKASLKSQLDGLSTEVMKNMSYGLVDPMSFRMPKLPEMKSVWEIQSELYMKGLRDQARSFESSLKPDEELVMTCWHGHEKLQVLYVSMPSENVVALHCLDTDGNHVQITGHMNAVTFSFMVYKIEPPARPNKIGFSMPE
jgi:hypothetical protein